MARYKNYIYIGSTNRDLRRRISEHKKELKYGRKNKLYHILKYEGFENFKFLIIEDHINITDLKMKELFYYNLFVKDPLFNILNERQPLRTKEYKLMYDRLYCLLLYDHGFYIVYCCMTTIIIIFYYFIDMVNPIC
jgi:group I intron endonuclease